MKRIGAQTVQNRSAASFGPPETDAIELPYGDVGEDIRRLRPLTVLKLIGDAAQPLTLAQLVGLMRVPKSTLMRLLRTLEWHGYVVRLPEDGGFVTGPAATGLALQTLRGSSVRRACRAVLRRLVQKLGETCNLTVPDACRVLYLERVETSEPLRMHLQPGTRVPMHCTASGKLFLASMSAVELHNVLTYLPLPRHAPQTIVDRESLRSEILKIAKQGIGMDNEEFIRGMIAIAVPVIGHDDHPVAAVACHAPTARLKMSALLDHVAPMRAAAEAMRGVLLDGPQSMVTY